MTESVLKFGIKLNNIAELGLRLEFKKNYGFICSSALDEYLKSPVNSLGTPYGKWTASPDSLMTFILQKSILGVESYLPIALKNKANQLGRLNELFEAIDEAFGWRVLFKTIPKIIDPVIDLEECNKQLYQNNEKFYKQVRNPLFHGCEIQNSDVVSLRASFSHIKEIYMWIDGWYTPETSHNFNQVEVGE